MFLGSGVLLISPFLTERIMMNLFNLELVERLPPEEVVFQMALTFGVSQSLLLVVKLGIADLLEDGARHYEELAEASGAHPKSLYRLLRALASLGIFAEVRPGCFELTPPAACLQNKETHSIRHFLLFLERTYQCWTDSLETLRTGENSHERMFGHSLYASLDQRDDPEFCEIYDRGIAELSQMQDAAIVHAYDFSGIGKLVDVGGGTGNLMAAILRKYPAMEGILLDRRRAVEKAGEVFRQQGLSYRCEARVVDFFKDALPRDAEAYLIKYVLHTLENAEVIKLLRNCRVAMGPRSRLLVIERVIGEQSGWLSKFADLNLLMVFSAAVRTEAEFRDLFKAAGFELTRVIPTGAIASLLEARPV